MVTEAEIRHVVAHAERPDLVLRVLAAHAFFELLRAMSNQSSALAQADGAP